MVYFLSILKNKQFANKPELYLVFVLYFNIETKTSNTNIEVYKSDFAHYWFGRIFSQMLVVLKYPVPF